MKLDLTAFTEAVRSLISDSLAGAIPQATATHYSVAEPPKTINDADAGEILIAALGMPSAMAHVLLSNVVLNGTEVIDLDAEDTLAHPLLVGFPDTLGAALAAPVISGARGYFMAMGQPNFVQVDLGEAPGAQLGSLNFTVSAGTGMISGMALYGLSNEGPSILRTTTLYGARLYEIGRLARTRRDRSLVTIGPSGLAKVVVGGTTAVH